MNKEQRLHIKQQKRIMRLLYRTGLLEEVGLSPEDLYICDYGDGKKAKKRRKIKRSKYPDLERGRSLLDFYHETVSYGECGTEYDSEEVLWRVREHLWWKHHNNDVERDEDGMWGYGTSNFKWKGQAWFINYLRSLPVVISDNKINRVVNRVKIDY